MSRTLLLGAAGVMALAIAACAPAMQVSSHVDRERDFSHYQTFNWGAADPLPTGDPRLEEDPLFRDRVQGAIERQLRRRGLTLVSSAPDLLIHFHASITEDLQVAPDATRDRYGACYGAGCGTDLIGTEKGTLVIDLVDASTDTLVWRGWARDSVADLLDDPDKMAATIDEAVTRMFERLPASLGH
ncbi:MAG: DUF4136 domain-containing protein [Vicinamibacterales bacterium]